MDKRKIPIEERPVIMPQKERWGQLPEFFLVCMNDLAREYKDAHKKEFEAWKRAKRAAAGG
ncbi:hypothetical protein [Megasphaera hominis]|jgi:hypothetical protein|uniref:Uncharacterized protein n=1 Tax=Megasphaera hominis TaxID=159836 RepID=A0ABR6VJ61_9FIRM|nr:hypothetical protein [Megasphaera hominis]MBC3537329.1 hypothetical protein [Megasphaera hominis]